ncbi:MAG: DUF309 domain-containing protein [Chloracidobacterium sp.]|uniref:DUF309 domain-containing protein n=1 Tax=Chloracidobacterium validum TaxID=2821543 RepID=A0ABX8B799_9BACT|nr:DUF309 domain-containing protein [Chloracidobacterium validum]QUW02312.1 DUF309 domain-containing protein [Chloracidobacterium validum]
MSSPLSWDAFCGQLRPPFVPPFGCPETLAFALPTLDALHWLDRQAIKLAARLDRPTRLIFDESPPPYLQARLEAQCFARTEADPQLGQIVPYAAGFILHWVRCAIPTSKLVILWRDYQTSLDRAHHIPAGNSYAERFPHLRLGLIAGADLFNCGEFYAAHEDWESLWMRLPDGGEKLVVQGLIQLCGVHIHRLKGRQEPMQTMLDKARANIEDGAATTPWLDAERLLRDTEAIVRSPMDAPIGAPEIPLVNEHPDVPRKHR